MCCVVGQQRNIYVNMLALNEIWVYVFYMLYSMAMSKNIVVHEYFHEWNDLESGGALHPRSLQSVPSILVSDPKKWIFSELCSFFCSSPEIDLALFSSMNVSQGANRYFEGIHGAMKSVRCILLFISHMPV